MRCPLCISKKNPNCPLCFGTGYKIRPEFRESNECYTPRRFIELARKVMGTIDLDPASTELANETVKARNYFDIYDDGLRQKWYGNVWLNPPYSRVNGGTYQELFINKALEEYHSGRVSEIIMLLHGLVIYNYYYKPLWEWPTCIVSGTIYFGKADGSDVHDGRGNVFTYMGPSQWWFAKVFSEVGQIVKGV